MGYQESYVTCIDTQNGKCIFNENKFDKMVSIIQSNTVTPYEYNGFKPVEIITLGKSVTDSFGRSYKKGTKFIYFVGERFPQSHANFILHPQCDDCKHWKGTPCDGGHCAPWYCNNSNNCEWYKNCPTVIFTEYISPEGIWDDAGKPVTAKHDKFTFE